MKERASERSVFALVFVFVQSRIEKRKLATQLQDKRERVCASERAHVRVGKTEHETETVRL